MGSRTAVNSNSSDNSFDTFLHNMNAFFVDNAKVLVGVLAAALVIVAGYSIMTYFASAKEKSLQEKYFVLEKNLQTQRKKWDDAAQAAKNPVPSAKEKAGPLASGDLAKDYGDIPQQMESFIDSAPKSTAAAMAALNLSHLYAEHKKSAEALAVLNKVNSGNSTGEFVDALVVYRKASLQADSGDCAGASNLWQKIAADKNAKYLHADSKLGLGLCAEKGGDLAAAEKFYSEAASGPEAKDSFSAKEAGKYLRLLKTKQPNG